MSKRVVILNITITVVHSHKLGASRRVISSGMPVNANGIDF